MTLGTTLVFLFAAGQAGAETGVLIDDPFTVDDGDADTDTWDACGSAGAIFTDRQIANGVLHLHVDSTTVVVAGGIRAAFALPLDAKTEWQVQYERQADSVDHVAFFFAIMDEASSNCAASGQVSGGVNADGVRINVADSPDGSSYELRLVTIDEGAGSTCGTPIAGLTRNPVTLRIVHDGVQTWRGMFYDGDVWTDLASCSQPTDGVGFLHLAEQVGSTTSPHHAHLDDVVVTRRTEDQPPGGAPPPAPPKTIPDIIDEQIVQPAVATIISVCNIWLLLLLAAAIAVASIVRRMKRSGDVSQ